MTLVDLLVAIYVCGLDFCLTLDPDARVILLVC